MLQQAGNQTLTPNPVTYFGYQSKVALPIMGRFATTVRHGDRFHETYVSVLSGSATCLLSKRTGKELGILNINTSVHQVIDTRQVNYPVEHEPRDPIVEHEPAPVDALQQPQVDERHTQNDRFERIDANKELSKDTLKSMFPSLFSGKLGCAKGIKIKLDIDPNARKVRQALRPIPMLVRPIVESEIWAHVDNGIMSPYVRSMGPTSWIANLVIVPKETVRNVKCGSSRPIRPQDAEPPAAVRIMVDNRPQNPYIQRTRFPCKSIEDLTTQVAGATIFSKLDIMKAFHQLELDEASKNLTVITTHIGLFRYNRLHMGISCASELFTEAIRVMLLDLPGQINMTDDVLIYGKTRAEHQRNLLAVLKRLEENGLTLNLDKCEFYRKELTFYGLRFCAEGVSPTESRVKALLDATPPTNAKELKSFLCALEFSQRFIKDFATIAFPLRLLTHAGVEWRWTSAEQLAFDKLKKAMSTQALASFVPDPDGLEWITEVEVDASTVGVSAILSQVKANDPKDRRIVCYASRTLTDVESRYSQCEKEALACVWGCERFWIYLFGGHFRLVTDNRAVMLIFANTTSRPPARIERLALRLSQFDFEIVHRPGITNPADYFSRHPMQAYAHAAFLDEVSTRCYIHFVVSCNLPQAMTIEDIELATASDKQLQSLISWLSSGQDRLPAELSEFKHVSYELNMYNGLVLRNQAIIVPQSLRARVIDLAHSSHQGISKTKALIRSRLWFPGIDAEVERKVKYCVPCQAVSATQTYEPLKPNAMPEGPWERISADFFGPLALQDGSYWLVLNDEYSRFKTVHYLRSTSMDLLEPILDNIFTILSTPLEFKSDNGPPFSSQRFEEYAARMGFKHVKVTPLWPRANGEVEAFMKQLGDVLRIAHITKANKFHAAQHFVRVYNDTPHSTTGVPPNILQLGYARSCGLPCLSLPVYSEFIRAQHELARKNDQAAKLRQKAEYDRRMRATELRLQVGDHVLYRLRGPGEVRPKHEPKWDPGRYVITEIKGSMITAPTIPSTLPSSSTSPPPVPTTPTRNVQVEEEGGGEHNVPDQEPVGPITTPPQRSTLPTTPPRAPQIQSTPPWATPPPQPTPPTRPSPSPQPLPPPPPQAEPAKKRGRKPGHTRALALAEAVARELEFQQQRLRDPPPRVQPQRAGNKR